MSKKTFIFLVSSLLIGLGFSIVQAAPTFQTSPTIASTTSGIIFVGSPTHYIDWSSYDGNSATADYAVTAGTATNADAVDGYSLNQNVLTTSSPTFNKLTISNNTVNSTLLYLSGADYDKWVGFSGHGLHIGTTGYTHNAIYLGPYGSTSGTLNNVVYFNWSDATPVRYNRWSITSTPVLGAISGYANDGTTVNTLISATGDSYFNVGNVGIGTTAPGYKLDVQDGQVNASGGLCIAGVCQTSWSAVGGQWTTSGDNIYNSNKGNVGIGTTAPAAKLSVSGTGVFSDVLTVKNTASTPSIWSGKYGGAISILGDNATANRYIDLSIVNSTGVLSNQGLRIINGGNVGIGITDPSEKLHVSNGASQAVSFNLGENNITKFTTAANGSLTINADVGGSDGSMILQARGLTHLYLNGTGNVGIGTTAPGEKLHVVGDLKVVSDSDVSTALGSGAIYIQNIAGTAGIQIDTNEIQSIGANLYIQNDNAQPTHINNLLHLTTAGYVGIGTTAPNAPLTIVSSGVSGGNITFRSDRTDSTIFENSYSLNMKSANGLNFDYDGNLNGGGAFNVYEGATSRFYIAGSSGNVGIGTTAPGYKLDVAGDIRAVSFIYSSSDRSLKKNITTISNPLDKISQLRGVTFDWKSNNEASIGLIAQEVEKVYPELVKGDDGSKAIQYSGLIAPLIEAVKEQQREINNLETRLQILEAK
jgi:hypothetical protein